MSNDLLLLGGVAALVYLISINKADSSILPNLSPATTQPADMTPVTAKPTTAKSETILNPKPTTRSYTSQSFQKELMTLGKVEQDYWVEKKGVDYANAWTKNFNDLNAALAAKRT